MVRGALQRRRATCPVCGMLTVVKGDGTFLRHSAPSKPGQPKVTCPGSGRDAGLW
jgi:hypothetical protein